MKARFTDEQINAIIKEQEAGEKTTDVWRPHRISGSTASTVLPALMCERKKPPEGAVSVLILLRDTGCGSSIWTLLH